VSLLDYQNDEVRAKSTPRQAIPPDFREHLVVLAPGEEHFDQIWAPGAASPRTTSRLSSVGDTETGDTEMGTRSW